VTLPNLRASLGAWHSDLLSGDRDAPERITSVLTTRLRMVLAADSRGVPSDLINDGIEDALIAYLSVPNAFDGSRGVPLDLYVLQAARWNVLNSLEASHRRVNHEREFARVTPQIVASPEERLIRRERAASLFLRVMEISRDARERAAILTWLHDPRATAAIAHALRIDASSPTETCGEVKRFKDRMKRRIARLAGHTRISQPNG